MSGSATLATDRFRLATPATRISAASTSPARSGASPTASSECSASAMTSALHIEVAGLDQIMRKRVREGRPPALHAMRLGTAERLLDLRRARGHGRREALGKPVPGDRVPRLAARVATQADPPATTVERLPPNRLTKPHRHAGQRPSAGGSTASRDSSISSKPNSRPRRRRARAHTPPRRLRARRSLPEILALATRPASSMRSETHPARHRACARTQRPSPTSDASSEPSELASRDTTGRRMEDMSHGEGCRP